jgi:hypothetical protein
LERNQINAKAKDMQPSDRLASLSKRVQKMTSKTRTCVADMQKKPEPLRLLEQEPTRQHNQEPVQLVALQAAYRRAQIIHNGLTSADLLALQRTVGNRQVQRLLAQRRKTSGANAQATIQLKLPSSPGTGSDESEMHEENKTGLPDNLKTGIENLSGLALDEVKVHYNSSKPTQLGAAAYTQGTDIHVGSGQEKHLPHEAWHVAQQMQGRVKSTMQLEGVSINDDNGLEQEANRMGTKALQMKRSHPVMPAGGTVAQLVIIAPPIDKLDAITLIAIYQMLRNRIDDRVAGYELLKKSGDELLKGEKNIYFKGHGELGTGKYAETATGADLGKLLRDKAPERIAIFLDYCHSANAARDLSDQLVQSHSIVANKDRSVTQSTGGNFSKIPPDRLDAKQKEVQAAFIAQCEKIRLSPEWVTAEKIAGELKNTLQTLLAGNQLDVKTYTELIIAKGKAIFEIIETSYSELYTLNEKLIDAAGRILIQK